MKIYRSLQAVPDGFGPAALTIGNFDGVHLGHRRILRRVAAVARERGLRPSALTFDPHPTRVVAPDRAPCLMTPPEQRCALMAEEGIEQVLILPFTGEIARIPPEDFAQHLLAEKLGVQAVLVGDNFRFGHRQAGDVELLKRLGERFGFTTEIVAAVRCRNRMVSSSTLRELIRNGAVGLAARLLARPYRLEGEVVSGRGVGRHQTVPTLNLATHCEVIPATGVYVTRTGDLDDGRTWDSVTNVGYRPTFGANDELSIETFLLGPFRPPAPRRIRVEFLHRIRGEQRFATPEALKARILRDVGRAEAWFRRTRRWVGAVRIEG